MLNKKGMSLIEMLVSIILTGIILVFLFNILIDLKNETKSNDYAYDNQVTRAEIIYTIMKDLQSSHLVKVEDISSNNLALVFTSNDGVSSLVIDKDDDNYYLRYNDMLGKKYSWQILGDVDNCSKYTFKLDNNAKRYYLKLNIYIYTDNEKNNLNNNNPIDDIEIVYNDLIKYLDLDSDLTNSDVDNYIGNCTNKGMINTAD